MIETFVVFLLINGDIISYTGIINNQAVLNMDTATHSSHHLHYSTKTVDSQMRGGYKQKLYCYINQITKLSDRLLLAE